MEEKNVSKILPQNEVLDKIKDFYLKCKNVNNLYELHLNTKKKTDEETFEEEWRKLFNENNHYFRALSIEDSDWPSKKSYLIELKVTNNVLVTDTIFPDEGKPFKLPTKKNNLTKIKIAYGIADNQGDYTPESEFPFFGMYLMLILCSEEKNLLCIVTANTKNGCKIISSPIFNAADSTITAKKTELKFENEQHFTNIINLVEEYLKLVNDTIGEEAFVSNLKL